MRHTYFEHIYTFTVHGHAPLAVTLLPLLTTSRDDVARAALFISGFQAFTGAAAVALQLYVMNSVMAETARRDQKKEQKEERKSLGHHAVHNVKGNCHRGRPRKGLEP